MEVVVFDAKEWQFEEQTIGIHPAITVPDMTREQLEQALCFMMDIHDKAQDHIVAAGNLLGVH